MNRDDFSQGGISMSRWSFRRLCLGLAIPLAFAGAAVGGSTQADPPSATGKLNPKIEKRISTLISRMTLEEKVGMLGGVDSMNTVPIPRLGIPAIQMNDGPLGVRLENPAEFGQMTAFPAGIAMGASWDADLVREVAKAIADETRFVGHNMLLGPCVNISRNPFGGRNFESFGEDPHLSSILGVSYVKGIQGQNVLASVKHFALNEQEHERMSVDVKADARAMFELHFPMFKAAIDAGSWTVMASYNKVNGRWASENRSLLTDVLKKRWGFNGFVVSDWGATHSVVDAANAGLDLEMPSGEHFGPLLVQAVREGKVKMSTIDDKVRRILRAMFVVGLIDPSFAPRVPAPLGPESAEHKLLARRMARESAVLLKNDGRILPIRPHALRRVAVIGPNAAIARTGGGGSSHVDVPNAITPLTALQSRVGRTVSIDYVQGVPLPTDITPVPTESLRPAARMTVQGLKAEYFANKELAGEPILTRIEPTVELNDASIRALDLRENFSVRWTGFLSVPSTGTYRLQTLSDDGVRLFLDEQEIISNWSDHGGTVDAAELELAAGRWYPVRLEYYQNAGGAQLTFGWTQPHANSIARAVETAKNADVALIFAGMGYDESEGFDRPHMNLPEGQDELIKAVAAANPNTVVVLTGGNPVAMGEWIGDVKGLLHVWYPGQYGAEATVDVLTGVVNPSGKLPVTFLKRWEDSAAYGNYPGENGEVRYEEGLFVGYRHHDRANIAPEFPFGFGLSYTTFEYSGLDVRVIESSAKKPAVQVTFNLTNTGNVAGAEVAQLYVGELRPKLARPPKELKGFRKIVLAPGETRSVTMTLDSSAFAYFDPKPMAWKVTPGEFRIGVGGSSRDLPLETTIRLGN